MREETIDYTEDGTTFEARVVWDDARGPRPAVLVAHAWSGQTEIERGWARALAELGYVGVALDVYGKGVVPSTDAEKRACMAPLVEDRARLARRLLAGIEAARAHRAVESERVAAIGFCFGGLCVLDLARRGADLRGVVSFHGLLHAPADLAEGPRPAVRAKVLALHGYDDPMATPEAVVAFGSEMTAAKADWQLHAYGGTMHSFTMPGANAPERGSVYHPVSARRSRGAMVAFLDEVFA
jgi:dienelactone hydrolase